MPPVVDKFLIYANSSAMINALFPPFILNLKAESTNFFAFIMYWCMEAAMLRNVFFETVFFETVVFQTVFFETVFFETVFFKNVFSKTVFFQIVFSQAVLFPIVFLRSIPGFTHNF